MTVNRQFCAPGIPPPPKKNLRFFSLFPFSFSSNGDVYVVVSFLVWMRCDAMLLSALKSSLIFSSFELVRVESSLHLSFFSISRTQWTKS